MRDPERGAQIVDVLDQWPTPSLKHVDGKEIGATRHPHTAIVRHAAMVPW